MTPNLSYVKQASYHKITSIFKNRVLQVKMAPIKTALVLTSIGCTIVISSLQYWYYNKQLKKLENKLKNLNKELSDMWEILNLTDVENKKDPILISDSAQEIAAACPNKSNIPLPNLPGKSELKECELILVDVPSSQYERIAGKNGQNMEMLTSKYGVSIRIQTNSIPDKVILILSGADFEKRRATEEWIRNRFIVTTSITNIDPQVFNKISKTVDYRRVRQVRTKTQNGLLSITVSGLEMDCRAVEKALREE